MCGDTPQLQLKRKKKNPPIRTNKNTIFVLSPSQKSADLARVRDNQRRSRARRKEYLQELETKYWTCEQVGVGASAEIQAAARQVVNENKRLRALLMKYGISSREINGEGEETASSVVGNLEAMMGKRRACGSGGGTGGRADVMAAESCEKSLVAIRYGHSQMPDRGLRQLQMRGTIPSPQSSGNGLRENGGSLAGNTGVLQQQQQQQQQHNEAHQQQQHQQEQQQQFATLTHTLPPQAPLPPQQNHTPIHSNTHTYATTSASASSSTLSTSNPEQIYATTSTYSPGSSSSLYGGNSNNNNNYPDYCYTQQQQNHQHNDFFAHNNLDIYSAVAAVPVPQHQQQNQHQQNQYQQPNTSASCRDIADAIRCIRPSLTLQELDEEMGCHQLCDADGGGGGGGGSSCGGNGDCKVPHYKAFELMDRLSN